MWLCLMIPYCVLFFCASAFAIPEVPGAGRSVTAGGIFPSHSSGYRHLKGRDDDERTQTWESTNKGPWSFPQIYDFFREIDEVLKGRDKQATIMVHGSFLDVYQEFIELQEKEEAASGEKGKILRTRSIRFLGVAPPKEARKSGKFIDDPDDFYEIIDATSNRLGLPINWLVDTVGEEYFMGLELGSPPHTPQQNYKILTENTINPDRKTVIYPAKDSEDNVHGAFQVLAIDPAFEFGKRFNNVTKSMRTLSIVPSSILKLATQSLHWYLRQKRLALKAIYDEFYDIDLPEDSSSVNLFDLDIIEPYTEQTLEDLIEHGVPAISEEYAKLYSGAYAFTEEAELPVDKRAETLAFGLTTYAKDKMKKRTPDKSITSTTLRLLRYFNQEIAAKNDDFDMGMQLKTLTALMQKYTPDWKVRHVIEHAAKNLEEPFELKYLGKRGFAVNVVGYRPIS